MAKEIGSVVKLQIEAGKANPAPPVGTALGPRGVNIMEFCKEFNARTKDLVGFPIPIIINVYKDKTFSFITKEPTVTSLIKKATSLESGSKEAGKVIVGKIKMSQIKEIAIRKIKDMTSSTVEVAMREIAGSANSMGIEVIND